MDLWFISQIFSALLNDIYMQQLNVRDNKFYEWYFWQTSPKAYQVIEKWEWLLRLACEIQKIFQTLLKQQFF